MSAHNGATTGASTRAPTTNHDTTNGATANDADAGPRATVETDDQPRPSPVTTPTRRPEVEELSPVTRPGAVIAAPTIVSAVPAPTMITTDPIAAAELLGGFDDHADDRSSSLSELGDASDVESEQPTPRPIATADLNENDSEAETERLEQTPRKLMRTVTDTSLASDALYTRTPSKLVHSKTIENDDSAPPTPSDLAEDETMEDVDDDAQDPLHALSVAAASEAASLELAGKKRKRMSARGTPIDDDNDDEPARKRSASAKVAAHNGTTEDVIESSERHNAEEELDHAEERLDQLAREGANLEERQANLAAEVVGELATVAKHTKPRKGGRRGKRKVEDSSYAYNEALATTETVDGDVDGEDNEEDSAALDEEGKGTSGPCRAITDITN